LGDNVSSQGRTVYDIVARAQRLAIEAVKPGVKTAQIDRIARDEIDRAGYGRRFIHSTGHGVGVEIHEAPYVGPASTETLEPGMIITVEPGIYLQGWGGVRIEEGANPKLTVNDIISLEDVKVPLPKSLRIRVPLEKASENTVDELHLLFSQRKGDAKVLFDVEREGDFMVVMEAEGYNVLPDRSFIGRVEELCGRGAVRVID
jgi:methionine aminopeptidase